MFFVEIKKNGPQACGPFRFEVCFASTFEHQEQPLKSVRATVVSVAGVTTRATLLMSVVVMISEGEQSATPPLLGIAARASTVNGTGAGAGVE